MGFLDNLFGSKSSSSTKNEAYDGRAGSGRDLFQVSDDAKLNITDGKATKQGNKTARKALSSNTKVSKAAIKNAGKVNKDSLKTVAGIVGDQTALLQSTTGAALDFGAAALGAVTKASEDESARTIRATIPWLMAGVSVVAVAMFWKARR